MLSTRSDITSLINNIVEHFICFNEKVVDLYKSCSDSVKLKNSVFYGNKFQLCLILEAFQVYRDKTKDNSLTYLEKHITSTLIESFETTGFTYLSSSALPADLDTLSILTRVLRKAHPKIVLEYDAFVNRNKNKDGLIPTWLDLSNPSNYRAGDNPVHMEVMLNYWLTEATLGRKIILDPINNLLLKQSLFNYWYFPILYAPYLFTKLIYQSNLEKNENMHNHILTFLNKWENGSKMLIEEKLTNCSFEEIKQQIRVHGFSEINKCLCYNIKKTIGIDVKNEMQSISKTSFLSLHSPLYWTVGLKPYFNEHITRALILTCLLETL